MAVISTVAKLRLQTAIRHRRVARTVTVSGLYRSCWPGPAQPSSRPAARAVHATEAIYCMQKLLMARSRWLFQEPNEQKQ